MIAIVDYGAGNLRSVERALAACGASPEVTADPDRLDAAAGIVLPGVGAFGPAVARLRTSGVGRRIVDLARAGRPVMGVCLGYQLLFETSEEGGSNPGLALLPGRVRRIRGAGRVPVIGWCRVGQVAESVLWSGIPDASWFYFVHSYGPESSPCATASAAHTTCAAAQHANVMGTQFHPEKSAARGLRVYENFVRFCGAG